MIDGFRKEDPPVRKKLPVEVDVLELLCTFGLMEKATAKESAVGDLTLLAFYFLWRVGEYIMKNTQNNSKQTAQFALKDVLFFRRNAMGQLRQLSSRRASDEEILESVGVSFLLRNQKMVGRMCVCTMKPMVTQNFVQSRRRHAASSTSEHT
jgi:hypothetical protein